MSHQSELDLAKKLLLQTVEMLMEGASYDVEAAENCEKEAAVLRSMSETKLSMVRQYNQLLAIFDKDLGVHLKQ